MQYGVPQGSVLGPLLFNLYMSPTAQVISAFAVSHMQYADDTQLYVALRDVEAIPTLTGCFHAVYHWLDLNGLSLNPEKTEAIVIGTSSRHRREGEIATVQLGDVTVHLSNTVKNLGVIIDDSLSFNDHVNSVYRSSHFHLRAFRHIRKIVSEDTAKTVGCAMVHCRLDYCNSLLYKASITNIQKLQRIQNSLARIVTGSSRTDSITTVLAKLHWLPIQSRIQFKLAVTAYKALTTQSSYLADLLQYHVPSRQLRSSSRNLLREDCCKLKFADRAFRHAAPTLWNSLPSGITSNLSTLTVFKRSLKTELYRRVFQD